MLFGDAIQQLATTGYEPLFSNGGKALRGVKDRNGEILNHPTEGEIMLLAEGLTVAMLNRKRRSDMKVKAHSA